MREKAPQQGKDSESVPWSDVVHFIRQLSHDLRNDLNAIELQSAYISELEQNEELKGEIKRLRELVSGMTAALQRLSKAAGEVKPNPISYRAADLMEDLRARIAHDFSNENTEITWDIKLGDVTLNIDPQLLQEAFAELFVNAFLHDRSEGPLLARARIDNDWFLFTLHEPKAGFDLVTKNWGREPLRKMSQRHYGLGLNRLRAIVHAHGGELHAQYDSKTSMLITTLTLPLSDAPSKDT